MKYTYLIAGTAVLALNFQKPEKRDILDELNANYGVSGGSQTEPSTGGSSYANPVTKPVSKPNNAYAPTKPKKHYTKPKPVRPRKPQVKPATNDPDTECDDDDNDDDFTCDLSGRPKRIRTKTITYRLRWTRTRIRRFKLVCNNGKIQRKLISGPVYSQRRTKKGAVIGGRRTRQAFKIYGKGKTVTGKIRTIRRGRGRA